MSHEDYLDQDEKDALKAEFNNPLRGASEVLSQDDVEHLLNMMSGAPTETPKLLTRTSGYITVDIPPVTIPTPITVSRWLYGSSVVRGLLLVLLGVVFGYCGHIFHSVPLNNPPIVRPVTESLESFVARESEVLSASERRTLIAVTEKVLAQHFVTPAAMREAFRYERVLVGGNSSAFDAFSERWVAKVEEMQVAETVEAMWQVYESLLRGLKVQGYNDFSGGSVEGFLHSVSPSIVENPLATDEDEPDSPEVLPTSLQAVETKTVTQQQRQPIFRRR